MLAALHKTWSHRFVRRREHGHARAASTSGARRSQRSLSRFSLFRARPWTRSEVEPPPAIASAAEIEHDRQTGDFHSLVPGSRDDEIADLHLALALSVREISAECDVGGCGPGRHPLDDQADPPEDQLSLDLAIAMMIDEKLNAEPSPRQSGELGDAHHPAPQETDCVICLSQLEDAVPAGQCMHRFCRACILSWVGDDGTGSKHCPTCRAPTFSSTELLSIPPFDRPSSR
mmetsp:Transcript_30077/g.80765  ORF Transcript_30077/g.80765 Transcript_30077/m.80765 type:complete len:231 (-) Transcript_30077:601-1293(-)